MQVFKEDSIFRLSPNNIGFFCAAGCKINARFLEHVQWILLYNARRRWHE